MAADGSSTHKRTLGVGRADLALEAAEERAEIAVLQREAAAIRGELVVELRAGGRWCGPQLLRAFPHQVDQGVENRRAAQHRRDGFATLQALHEGESGFRAVATAVLCHDGPPQRGK